MDKEQIDGVAARVAAELGQDGGGEGAEKGQKTAQAAAAKAAGGDEGQQDQQEGAQAASTATKADAEVERAIKAGWQRKEDWVAAGKDPDEWIPARAFNKNGELYDSVRSVKTQLRETLDTVKALSAHNSKLAEAVRKREVGERMQRRDEAIEKGDKAAVRQIDGEIKELEKALPAVAAAAVDPRVTPETEQWIASRPWMKDKTMQSFAAALHQTQLDAGDQRPLMELYAEVEERVKAAFPKNFPAQQQDQNQQGQQGAQQQTRKLSAVEAPAGRITKTSKGWADLPEEAKEVGRKFERQGVMGRDEYVKQYFATN